MWFFFFPVDEAAGVRGVAVGAGVRGVAAGVGGVHCGVDLCDNLAVFFVTGVGFFATGVGGVGAGVRGVTGAPGVTGVTGATGAPGAPGVTTSSGNKRNASSNFACNLKRFTFYMLCNADLSLKRSLYTSSLGNFLTAAFGLAGGFGVFDNLRGRGL